MSQTPPRSVSPTATFRLGQFANNSGIHHHHHHHHARTSSTTAGSEQGGGHANSFNNANNTNTNDAGGERVHLLISPVPPPPSTTSGTTSAVASPILHHHQHTHNSSTKEAFEEARRTKLADKPKATAKFNKYLVPVVQPSSPAPTSTTSTTSTAAAAAQPTPNTPQQHPQHPPAAAAASFASVVVVGGGGGVGGSVNSPPPAASPTLHQHHQQLTLPATTATVLATSSRREQSIAIKEFVKRQHNNSNATTAATPTTIAAGGRPTTTMSPAPQQRRASPQPPPRITVTGATAAASAAAASSSPASTTPLTPQQHFHQHHTASSSTLMTLTLAHVSAKPFSPSSASAYQKPARKKRSEFEFDHHDSGSFLPGCAIGVSGTTDEHNRRQASNVSGNASFASSVGTPQQNSLQYQQGLQSYGATENATTTATGRGGGESMTDSRSTSTTRRHERPSVYRRVLSFQRLDGICEGGGVEEAGDGANAAPFPHSPTTMRGPMMFQAVEQQATNSNNNNNEQHFFNNSNNSSFARGNSSGGGGGGGATVFTSSFGLASPSRSNRRRHRVGGFGGGIVDSILLTEEERRQLLAARKREKQEEEMRRFAEKIANNSSFARAPGFSAGHGGSIVTLPSVKKSQLSTVVGPAGAVRHKGTDFFSDDLPPPRLVAHAEMGMMAPKGSIFRTRSADELLQVEVVGDEEEEGGEGKGDNRSKSVSVAMLNRQHRFGTPSVASLEVGGKGKEGDKLRPASGPAGAPAHAQPHHRTHSPQIFRVISPAPQRFPTPSTHHHRKSGGADASITTPAMSRAGSTVAGLEGVELTEVTSSTVAEYQTIGQKEERLHGEGDLLLIDQKPALEDGLAVAVDGITAISKIGSEEAAEDEDEEEVEDEDEDEYEVISYVNAATDMLPFAAPATTSYCLALLVSVIPLSYVGRFHGTSALNGASVGFFFISVCVWYPIQGTLFAVDTLASHEYGRDPTSDGIGLILQRGLIVALGALALLFGPVYVSLSSILSTFYDEKTTAAAVDFLTFSPLFVACIIAYTGFMKFVANQMMPSLATVSTIVGVAASPLLQAWLCPMGLRYSMLGMGIAAVLQLVTLVSLILAVKQTRRTLGSLRFREAIQWEDMRPFLKIALPSAAFIAAEAGALDSSILIASSLGDGVGSAWSALMNTEFLLISLANGMSVAACAKVGAALGANQPVNARTYAFSALFMVVLWGLCVNLPLILFFFEHMMSGFGADVAEASKVKYIFIFTQLFEALEFACQGIFSGANLNHVGAPLLIFSMWGVGVTTTVTLSFGLIPKLLRALGAAAAAAGLGYPLWSSPVVNFVAIQAFIAKAFVAFLKLVRLNPPPPDGEGVTTLSTTLAPTTTVPPTKSSSSMDLYWIDTQKIIVFFESFEGIVGVSAGTTLGLFVLCPLLLRVLYRLDWDSVALQGQIDEGEEEDEDEDDDDEDAE